ncbi:MAG: hypothetical protein ACYC4L_08865 [Chloroflexota bacterium]
MKITFRATVRNRSRLPAAEAPQSMIAVAAPATALEICKVQTHC